MKTVLRRIGALLLTAGCVHSVWAMQNEPRDFKGVPWGAPLDEYKQQLKLLSGDEQLAHFRREGDALTYGSVDVRRISYSFYKNRFSGGMLVFVGTSNLNSMLDYLTRTYGPPTTIHTRHRIYAWVGVHAGVTVSCEISISCYAEFYDKALREQELAEQGAGTNQSKRDDD